MLSSLPPCLPRLCSSRWGSDPLFRGSYSYLGPDCTPADVEALAAPLYAPAPAGDGNGAAADGGAGAPVLLFAGEAAHTKYIGTMHGAYLTGERAAERLVAALTQRAQVQA